MSRLSAGVPGARRRRGIVRREEGNRIMPSSNWDRYVRVKYAIPDRTWVWQLSGAGFDELRLVEIPRPRPGPEDIAFRVDSNSLCFSDTKVIAQGCNHPRLAGYDMKNRKVVLGHEMSITVVERGEKADPSFRIGGRYIVQADMLKYNTAVGYAVWGGLIQYGVFDRRVQEYLIPVAKKIGYSEASLVEPWACVEASYHRADVNGQDRVVWLCGGGGPMGQMHLARMLSLKRTKACPSIETILVTDLSDARLRQVAGRYGKEAGELGVRLICLNPSAPDYASRLDEALPSGADYIVALAPVPRVIEDSMRKLNKYGVLNLFAGLKRGTGDVKLGDIHYDQHTVTGNTGSRIEHMVKVLRMTEKGILDTNSSAGVIAGFRSAREGLEAVASASVENKIVVYPQLMDLPMTPVEKMADVIPGLPEDAAEKLRRGLWSREAERAMLENLWTP
jgi:threonine dehydrogenase-like Zn-dependent dehydrogenase